jgi:hypothetical protein
MFWEKGESLTEKKYWFSQEIKDLLESKDILLRDGSLAKTKYEFCQ